ncbi:hypothetical protein BJ742DRAFT_774830 [Cladochytrium replicatum]|nr:hypothetical protein BJ742DRAFT_774830 [Cladochytrium replicatum]
MPRLFPTVDIITLISKLHTFLHVKTLSSSSTFTSYFASRTASLETISLEHQQAETHIDTSAPKLHYTYQTPTEYNNYIIPPPSG